MSIRLSYINWILRPWQIRINKLEGIGRALYRDKHEQDIEKLGKDKGGNKKISKISKKTNHRNSMDWSTVFAKKFYMCITHIYVYHAYHIQRNDQNKNCI